MRTPNQDSCIRRARILVANALEMIKRLEDDPTVVGKKLIDALDSAAAPLNDAAMYLENVEVDE